MGLKHHKANENERPDSSFYEAIPEHELSFIGRMGPICNGFYESGARNAELPQWKTGSRFGAVPEDGVSRNWTDGRDELGVSMSKVEGNSYQWYPMARQSAEKKYKGWLLDHDRFWGSDGEPLMLGLKEISSSEAENTK